MDGGGGENGKMVGMVRKKVLQYERVEKKLAAAAHSSSPGRKRASNGGCSSRGADCFKENQPLLLRDEDDDDAIGREDREAKMGKQEEGGGGWNSKMAHSSQVAKMSHQLTAEVPAGGLQLNAPNRHRPPSCTSMDGNNKLATAMEVDLAECNSSSPLQFADQAGAKDLIWSIVQQAVEEALMAKWNLQFTNQDAKALIWSLVQQAVEEALLAKWKGLVNVADVKTFVESTVEKAHAARWEGLPDAAAVKAFIEHLVEEDQATITSFVLQKVEEAQAAKWEGLANATSLKRFVQQAVHQAQSEKQTLEENFIVLTVKEAVEKFVQVVVEELVSQAVAKHFPQLVPDNGISALDRSKLVKDAFVEHAALARALFVFGLGFTIPFLIARRGARPSDDELPVSGDVIKGMAKEAAFTFLIETVLFVYLMFTHFIHIKGPRLSLMGRRIFSTVIGCLVTLWMLLYIYCIPDWLFKHWFWFILGGFLVVNWFITLGIGWFSWFVMEDRWIDD